MKGQLNIRGGAISQRTRSGQSARWLEPDLSELDPVSTRVRANRGAKTKLQLENIVPSARVPSPKKQQQTQLVVYEPPRVQPPPLRRQEPVQQEMVVYQPPPSPIREELPLTIHEAPRLIRQEQQQPQPKRNVSVENFQTSGEEDFVLPERPQIEKFNPSDYAVENEEELAREMDQWEKTRASFAEGIMKTWKGESDCDALNRLTQQSLKNVSGETARERAAEELHFQGKDAFTKGFMNKRDSVRELAKRTACCQHDLRNHEASYPVTEELERDPQKFFEKEKNLYNAQQCSTDPEDLRQVQTIFKAKALEEKRIAEKSLGKKKSLIAKENRERMESWETSRAEAQRQWTLLDAEQKRKRAEYEADLEDVQRELEGRIEDELALLKIKNKGKTEKATKVHPSWPFDLRKEKLQQRSVTETEAEKKQKLEEEAKKKEYIKSRFLGDVRTRRGTLVTSEEFLTPAWTAKFAALADEMFPKASSSSESVASLQDMSVQQFQKQYFSGHLPSMAVNVTAYEKEFGPNREDPRNVATKTWCKTQCTNCRKFKFASLMSQTVPGVCIECANKMDTCTKEKVCERVNEEKLLRLHQRVAEGIFQSASKGFKVNPQNPPRGLLLWHSVGAGKTLVSLALLNAFWEEPRPVYFVSIDTVNKKMNSNDSEFYDYFTSFERWRNLSKREFAAELKKRMNVGKQGANKDRLYLSYEQFANDMQLTTREFSTSDRGNFSGHGDPSKGALVIFDEAHEMHKPEHGASGALVKAFMERLPFKSSLSSTEISMPGKLKVTKAETMGAFTLLMTATPGNNMPEFVSMLNMVRDTDAEPFSSSNFDVFDKDQSQKFMEKCRGLVTFFDYSRDVHVAPKIKEPQVLVEEADPQSVDLSLTQRIRERYKANEFLDDFGTNHHVPWTSEHGLQLALQLPKFYAENKGDNAWKKNFLKAEAKGQDENQDEEEEEEGKPTKGKFMDLPRKLSNSQYSLSSLTSLRNSARESSKLNALVKLIKEISSKNQKCFVYAPFIEKGTKGDSVQETEYGQFGANDIAMTLTSKNNKEFEEIWQSNKPIPGKITVPSNVVFSDSPVSGSKVKELAEEINAELCLLPKDKALCEQWKVDVNKVSTLPLSEALKLLERASERVPREPKRNAFKVQRDELLKQQQGYEQFQNIIKTLKPGVKYFARFARTSTNVNLTEAEKKSNEFKANIRLLFNQPQNDDGKWIFLIIGGPGDNVSHSLLSTKHVILLAPDMPFAEETQGLGRALRMCSHERFPEDERILEFHRFFSESPLTRNDFVLLKDLDWRMSQLSSLFASMIKDFTMLFGISCDDKSIANDKGKGKGKGKAKDSVAPTLKKASSPKKTPQKISLLPKKSTPAKTPPKKTPPKKTPPPAKKTPPSSTSAFKGKGKHVKLRGGEQNVMIKQREGKEDGLFFPFEFSKPLSGIETAPSQTVQNLWERRGTERETQVAKPFISFEGSSERPYVSIGQNFEEAKSLFERWVAAVLQDFRMLYPPIELLEHAKMLFSKYDQPFANLSKDEQKKKFGDKFASFFSNLELQRQAVQGLVSAQEFREKMTISTFAYLEEILQKGLPRNKDFEKEQMKAWCVHARVASKVCEWVSDKVHGIGKRDPAFSELEFPDYEAAQRGIDWFIYNAARGFIGDNPQIHKASLAFYKFQDLVKRAAIDCALFKKYHGPLVKGPCLDDEEEGAKLSVLEIEDQKEQQEEEDFHRELRMALKRAEENMEKQARKREALAQNIPEFVEPSLPELLPDLDDSEVLDIYARELDAMRGRGEVKQRGVSGWVKEMFTFNPKDYFQTPSLNK